MLVAGPGRAKHSHELPRRKLRDTWSRFFASIFFVGTVSRFFCRYTFESAVEERTCLKRAKTVPAHRQTHVTTSNGT